ncbi:putative 50S ribosomal protein L3 [Leptotrichia hofstadii F0254]|uniref:Putative 50S ribosomal protein L3 n=1 Tax=Leptotrichia hofstadii F0254 TaxID=634994 RepID=C9N1T5_9FUSO|nr:putative 50S ribosomal protein L3 [Leptotrichia hofstadii F0254]
MILGKKIGMTQIFEDEKLIPVTVIEAGTNFITQIKTEEKEGYNAITLAYGDKKEKIQQNLN